jgi:hypothetical protein
VARDELGARCDAGLGQEACDVGLDRVLGKEEPGGSLAVGESFGKELEDVDLSARDPQDRERGRDW